MLSQIKIGDLTGSIPLDLGSDVPGEDAAMKDFEDHYQDRLPDGFEEIAPQLNREDERAFTRDTSAAFAGE